MEHTLFIGDFPIKTSISSGCSIATFDYQRVLLFVYDHYYCYYYYYHYDYLLLPVVTYYYY